MTRGLLLLGRRRQGPAVRVGKGRRSRTDWTQRRVGETEAARAEVDAGP